MSSLHLMPYATTLRVPQYCRFDIDSAESIDYEPYKYALLKKGIAIINLNFADNAAKIMNDIVNEIGLVHEHDSMGRTVWDVKVGGETGKESLAISHGDQEFSLHNDGAFEKEMPGYFGLYVVRADKFGGGINVLINTDKIIESLSEASFDILSTHKFKLRVPEEFHKDEEFIHAPLIDENHGFRYRHDIIERDCCSQAELEALAELELQLSLPQNMLKVCLQDQQILLLDNRRFLHARTQVKDKKRHLKRIRFNMPPLSKVS
ncbi:TfdA family taurine catabolism dioxygenase TauD [Sinobacterium caligoides]|uniref:TfdA family taurine catabolism dioxygenase TauD n=1 Tax=Sinobacterium caligoides TaxID=933926 RepID=A0A3N2E1P5_9GAMM|nr:TauD/TfdA family dioxygenase [Sinobacterium caligoides]ROS05495.1 TfdA family taurine catabolism dioxygenase TauD [Sinobacterium caligoides]